MHNWGKALFMGVTAQLNSGTDGLERSTVCVYIPCLVNIPISKYTFDKYDAAVDKSRVSHYCETRICSEKFLQNLQQEYLLNFRVLKHQTR